MSEEISVLTESPEQPSSGGGVFIVFGHDRASMLELSKMLKNRWQLPVIVLDERPGKGRTILQKFEEEASPASFAIAILTADDLVVKGDEKYRQSRPNVLYELGWFRARLGPERTLVLRNEGAVLPSVLEGISRSFS